MACESVPRADASTGFRVGPFDDPDRYAVGAPVEAGAEGILYRGHVRTPTTGLSLAVAVKALQPAYAGQVDQWAARWRDQVELLRSLQIPGLVAVREGFLGAQPHRAGERDPAGRNLYLVMNWVEGEALDRWMATHPNPDHLEVLKRLLPVAVALDTMHSGQLTGGVPVVHRDVKPANLLIAETGAVLVDFGLTRGLPSHPRIPGAVGTPGYVAPEVLAGGDYTPAADRYAFGATVFFLLTGSHLTAGASPVRIRRRLGAFPDELVVRVVAMLSTDPAARPTALANWVAQLRQSSLTEELLLSTAALPPPASDEDRLLLPVAGNASRMRPLSRQAKRRALILFLVLALGLAGGAAALVSTRREPTDSSQRPTSTAAPTTVAGPAGEAVADRTGPGITQPADAPVATRTARTTASLAPAPTAARCQNSFDRACGPFRWSREPVNRPLEVLVTYSPENPAAGQEVTFRIALVDPDNAKDLRITETYFGDVGGESSLPGIACEDGPTGTWLLPLPGPRGREEPTKAHTYAAPGDYNVRFSAASGSANPDPCQPPDPYASPGTSGPVRVVVGPAPAA